MRHYPEKAPDADDHHLPPSKQTRWSVRINPFYYDTEALAALVDPHYQGCDNCRHQYTETAKNAGGRCDEWERLTGRYVSMCSRPHNPDQDPNGPCLSWQREPTDEEMEWDGREDRLALPSSYTVYQGGNDQ